MKYRSSMLSQSMTSVNTETIIILHMMGSLRTHIHTSLWPLNTIIISQLTPWFVSQPLGTTVVLAHCMQLLCLLVCSCCVCSLYAAVVFAQLNFAALIAQISGQVYACINKVLSFIFYCVYDCYPCELFIEVIGIRVLFARMHENIW